MSGFVKLVGAFGFVGFLYQYANQPSEENYLAAKRKRDELSRCASDPQYRHKLLSSKIDLIRSSVISRHSEDYWDYANYEEGARALEYHLEAYDKSIATEIEDLKSLVKEGFIKPIDFLAKYQGDNFKEGATNLSALLGSAIANRQDGGFRPAQSVVDGHKKLVDFLFLDTEFKSLCIGCEDKKAALQPYYRPKVVIK